MPASPNIATKTLTGTYHNPDGTPASGVIRFEPSVDVRDVTGHVIIQQKSIQVTLDGSGSFSIELSVTDDPDANPIGWTWHVTQKLAEVKEFDFQLLTSHASPVDIAEIMPAEYVEPVFQYATVQQVNEAVELVAEANERMDLIEDESAVVIAAVVIHPFLVMGA